MVIPFVPLQERLPGMPEPFDPLPYAARDVDMAGDAFMGEILDAQTVDRCLQIARTLRDHIVNLSALELSALDRAERLCGGKRES